MAAPSPSTPAAAALGKSSSGAGLSELETLRGRFEKAHALMRDPAEVGSGARMHDRAASALFKLLLHQGKPVPILSPPRYPHIRADAPTFATAVSYPVNPRPRFPVTPKPAPDEPIESVEDRRSALMALAEDEDRVDDMSDEAQNALVSFIETEARRLTHHITNSPPPRKPAAPPSAPATAVSKPASAKAKPKPVPLSPSKPTTTKRASSRSSSPSQRSGKKARVSTGSTDENAAAGSATAPIEL